MMYLKRKTVKKCIILLILVPLLSTFIFPNYPGMDILISTSIAQTHNLATPVQTSSGVQLTWTNDPSASGYHVYRTSNQGMTRLTGATALPAGTTSYNDNNNIKDETIYQYEVAAIIDGNEMFSNAQALLSKTAPLKSTNPITLTPGPYYVDLNWGASPSTDLAFYEIYRDGNVVGRTVNNSYRDLGVTHSTTYTYWIKAVDYDGLKSDAFTSQSTTTLASAPTTEEKTLLTENFSGQWVKNPGSSTVLTLGGNAIWRLNGNGASNTTSAELSSSYPFNVEDSPNKAEISFDWTKNWGNDDARSNEGENVDIYLEYMPIGGSWSGLWSETATNRGNGSQTVQITNNPGNYLVRFRTVLSNSSRSGDWTEATIDNVAIKQTVSNTKPDLPTALTGASVNGTTNTLNWNAPSDTDLIGFRIFRKLQSDPSYPNTPYASTNSTTYIDAGAIPETSYQYKIAAVDSGNLESLGVETTLITPAGETRGDVTPPEAPGDVRVLTSGAALIELVWEPSPSNDVVEYGILRSVDGVSYSIVSTLPALTTIDKSLQSDTNYFYRMIAFDAAGNPSPPSNMLEVRTNPPDTIPPVASDDFIAELIGETYVKFKWTEATDNERIDRYEIEVDDGGWVKKGVFYYPSTVGTIEGLVPGSTYSFRIIAFDASNNPSEPVIVMNPVKTQVDLTPPKVLFKRPGEDSTSIGTKENILIRFDDILKKETINSSTIKVIYNPPTAALTYTPGEPIAGTFELNSNTTPTEVTFVPLEPLEQETVYEVQISGVENISGTPIESAVWAFTTGTSEYVQPHGDYSKNTVFCSMCHDTHTSFEPRLLKADIQETCMSCHNGLGSSFNIQVQLEKDGNPKPSHHPVFANSPSKEEGVQLSCISCHNPHDGGTNLDTGENNHLPRLLETLNKGNPTATPSINPTAAHDGNEVCWNCHGSEAGAANSKGYEQYSFGYLDGGEIVNPPNGAGASYGYRGDHQTYYPTNKGHSSVKMDSKKGEAETEGGAGINCVACHEKHGSDVKPLLRNNIETGAADVGIVNGKEFCYQCHTSYLDLSHADNTNPESASYGGKAVNEGRGHAQFDCQVCHNPHGTQFPNNLRLNYRVDTDSFRNFNAKDAELCFDCHDQTKLLTSGAALRGRQDKGNLHGSHITSSVQAACKNCHRPHGAISAENTAGLNHKIGFPSSQVSGKSYRRDATADDSLPGGSGSCTLNCHGESHSGDNYDGAYRGGSGISGFDVKDAFMLKDNWKSDSVLLNTRPDGTGSYDFGEYKIDYRNGPIVDGKKSHYRDMGPTPGDGYMWK